jgi:hypothetical protein
MIYGQIQEFYTFPAPRRIHLLATRLAAEAKLAADRKINKQPKTTKPECSALSANCCNQACLLKKSLS